MQAFRAVKPANRLKRFIKELLREKPDPTNPSEKWTNKKAAYAQYSIGDWTYGNPIVHDWGSKLTIGKYCSIAEGVTFLLGGNHRADWITTYPFNIQWQGFSHIQGSPATKGDTVVGNDVWIGMKSVILSGVQIGDGAIIGAGSVVTKNVAPYTIVAGNPAKMIRERFNPEQRDALLRIGWWNWPETRIREAVPMLLSGNIDEFVRTHTVSKDNLRK